MPRSRLPVQLRYLRMVREGKHNAIIARWHRAAAPV